MAQNATQFSNIFDELHHINPCLHVTIYPHHHVTTMNYPRPKGRNIILSSASGVNKRTKIPCFFYSLFVKYLT